MNRYFLFAIPLVLAAASCQKTKIDSTPAPPKIDACSLITKDEIQQIQGSPVKDVKPSDSADGSFRVSQCFYSTEVFNKSVSLAVTQTDPDSGKGRDPKVFWKEAFSRYQGDAKEQEGDQEKKKSLGDEEEGHGAPPKQIKGVGEDAWWTASRMGGALYVLKKNVMVRISIGGPESEESKIDKSKKLATKAVSRF